MAKRDEMFPSRFLKASDLNGKPMGVQIVSAERETLKDTSGKEQEKLILSFKGLKKQLALNATNWDSIVDILSQADSDDWIGGRVELYPAKTQLPGRGIVDCIRVRAPSQGEMPVATKQKKKKQAEEVSAEMNDEVPF